MAFEVKKNVLKQYIPEQGQNEAVVPVGIDTIGPKAFEICGELNSIILPDGIAVLKQYALDSYEFKIKRLRVPATLQETGKNSFPGGLKIAELPGGIVQFTMEHDSYEVTEIIAYLLGIAEKEFSELRAGSRLELALVALTAPNLINENAAEGILKYARAQKKKLLDIIFTNGLTDALGGVLDAGFITVKTVDDCIAQAGGNADMTAVLLNYKNNQLSPAEVKHEEQHRIDSAFKPLSVTDAKKNWSFDKNDEGTGYVLTSYKGTDANVEIPVMIGKLPVVGVRGICNCAHNSKFPYARQNWLQENIVSVRIPEGILAIEDFSFAVLQQLKMVAIPASVTKIGRWAFDKCPNLTIHAPAGSYAETYAKENDIPFVTE